MFDSLQRDSTKCAAQYELNSFVTKAKLGSRRPYFLKWAFCPPTVYVHDPARILILTIIPRARMVSE